MIGALILFLVPGLLAFLAALALRRHHRAIAWSLGSLPAALLAYNNLGGLGDPLVWLWLVLFWVPSLLGAHAGVALAGRFTDWRERRRVASPPPPR